ncbi:Antilisterial bacteriocin subtilosin biosynthesis protein AlbA [subsurface metagenome]
MEGLLGVTYRCNARCQICNTWKFPTKKEEEIKVKDLEKLPRMRFTNITGGEPFLREDIEDIVKVIKKKSKRIVISTNGFFTKKIIDLAKKNRDIGMRISIEGLSKANDELRGIKDGFDRGLRTLIELKHMGIKDIGFGITVSDKNAKDLLALYKLACAMTVEFATATVHNSYYFHKMDNEIINKDIVAGEFRKLVEEFLKTKRVKNWYRAYFNYGVINYIYGGKRFLPCEMGTELFYMDPLGEIRPCNGIEETMGNIKEKTFEEIWNGEEAERIRGKVARCQKNCWMIGSASPAMKKYFWKPTVWIIKNKWFRKDSRKNL